MSSTAISFQNVTKRFDDKTILNRFSLDIYEDEILSIIGPSGSGKSTILRILMTLEEYDEGTLTIYENKISAQNMTEKKKLHKIRSNLALVFQHFNLFPHLSVLENITLAPQKVNGASKERSEKKAIELLGMVGLSDKHNAMPNELSGGQKQRVAIARALAMEPKIVLLDEITSALDPELVKEVLDVIKKIAKDANLTFVIVTHEMAFAKEISDRICFIEDGEIVELNDAKSFFERPSHPRSREFINTIKF